MVNRALLGHFNRKFLKELGQNTLNLQLTGSSLWMCARQIFLQIRIKFITFAQELRVFILKVVVCKSCSNPCFAVKMVHISAKL